MFLNIFIVSSPRQSWNLRIFCIFHTCSCYFLLANTTDKKYVEKSQNNRFLGPIPVVFETETTPEAFETETCKNGSELLGVKASKFLGV